MASKSIQILVNEFPATRSGREAPNPKFQIPGSIEISTSKSVIRPAALEICCLFGAWNLDLGISVSALLKAVLLLDLMQ
jgi:hypothetical protein